MAPGGFSTGTITFREVHVPFVVKDEEQEKEIIRLRKEVAVLRAEVFRLRRQGKR